MTPSTPDTATVSIDRTRLAGLLKQEDELFIKNHKHSQELFERAKKSLHGGVPMNWMIKWASPFPVFVKEGEGAYFTCVDGHKYLDFCLGDTGAMTGHAPKASVEAIVDRIKHGTTFMLPCEDGIVVAEELAKRFGLPYWQTALTATDANRFVIRLCRQITGRQYVLVHNWCYHGSVDETFATLMPDGQVGPRRSNVGPPVNPRETTRVVEFNDIEALEKALSDGKVACVLAEPVMTNIGIIHPDEGYHQALRELTRKYGTYLVIDETHTICTGPGGYTRAHNLSPDFLTIGKPIASGLPASAYGFTKEVAEQIAKNTRVSDCDTGGIGGTLAGNALALAAMKATLQKVLTEEAYAKTIPLAGRFRAGVEEVIDQYRLPWIIKQLGCRVEYWFRPTAPRNGSEAAAVEDHELDRYMHLYALNRGILMTPFHNMALIAPGTSEADIDKHTQIFREAVESLLA
ncbi:MAG: aspartate aminotransferase family protein [Cyanobacteria bacterium SZAS LIN-3]|nr:aspartate aminotransferase family protein [Cyanobacteria bacterium SZAS LIN-3]MBS2010967.1 aspartate aminotransferase family protein [Cyanobacteria bacterium SZAS TMP-1]